MAGRELIAVDPFFIEELTLGNLVPSMDWAPTVARQRDKGLGAMRALGGALTCVYLKFMDTEEMSAGAETPEVLASLADKLAADPYINPPLKLDEKVAFIEGVRLSREVEELIESLGVDV